ncbi:hypothetical protein [Bosea sp. PAMC 26642]|uniref:hypothetical protein n=1 Tax=Bosea sp. (strain PAMC 26642) TaxID=1792307 RepID=UPI00076FFFF6|nr:hypothetical protein [Bosea sp. PAMC 26642]AMJ60568.1 hypothetical protein AXW83_09930 [Bosea sp. PAMC 26642]
MFRILLIIAVIAIGYDAVVHQGAYTRSAWTSAVGMTDSAVSNARQLGLGAREETRTQTN